MTMNTTTILVAALLTVGAYSAVGTGQTKTAADAYSDKCAVCHGANGAGKTAKGRKLKVKDVRETVTKVTPAQMAEIVSKGKAPDMDGFAKDFSPAMVTQIVEHYRGLALVK